jgi:ABC-type phosphate transport system auxiliary subunit
MSDSGEGLVDASSRLAERMDELEEERRQARNGSRRVDPVRARALESLRLAKADIGRQLATISHEARRQQLTLALAEVERRLADLEKTA